MDPVKPLLILNGQAYDLLPLLKTIRSCPLVAIKVEELNASLGFTTDKEHIVTTKPDYPQLGTSEVVFYKQHGAYTVLAGQVLVSRYLADQFPIIKGRLVSTPGLKKHRVETPPIRSNGAPAPYVDVLAHHARVSNPPRFSSNSNQSFD